MQVKDRESRDFGIVQEKSNLSASEHDNIIYSDIQTTVVIRRSGRSVRRPVSLCDITFKHKYFNLIKIYSRQICDFNCTFRKFRDWYICNTISHLW